MQTQPWLTCAFRHLQSLRILEARGYSSGTTSKFEVLVGLEIHVQLLANTKLFSGAKSQYGAPPNSMVAPFDAAIPGTLPVRFTH
jgi:GatB/GatE catalytic domain